MPRPRRAAEAPTVSKTIRLSPEAWSAVRALRRGADSDGLTIERVVLAALRDQGDPGRPAELPGQESLLPDVPLLTEARPGGRIAPVVPMVPPLPDGTAHHPSASPQARVMADNTQFGRCGQCGNEHSTLSKVTSLRKCDRCGATQGRDGVWR